MQDERRQLADLRRDFRILAAQLDETHDLLWNIVRACDDVRFESVLEKNCFRVEKLLDKARKIVGIE